MAAVAYPMTHDRRPAPAPFLPTRPAPRPRPTPTTYARRRAAAVLALALCFLLAAGAVVGLLGGGPLSAPEPPSSGLLPISASVHVVRPGDTLWTIARTLQPEGDVRALVDQLEAAAGGASLVVGQRIVLP